MAICQEERDRLYNEILRAPTESKRAELYAAQQALAWATDPLVHLAGIGDSVWLVEPSRICHSPPEM